MSKTLQERLGDAKAVLDRVHAALGRHPGGLPNEVETSFREVVDCRTDIDRWLELLQARTAALQMLDALEARADENDNVPFGATRIKYQHVRLLGVQAHVATNWALADRIAGMVGRVLCTPEAGANTMSPAQLVSHFVQKDRKKMTAGALFESVRRTFGWPIGVSYAIRNHFVHDGAQIAGTSFFEGPSSASAFRISVDGWSMVEERARSTYAVEPAQHRVGAGWPSTPRDDLRIVLTICQREMDDALGVLLGSASSSLLAHVGFMLGED